MIELIDTHTHLDAKDFDNDRDEVVQRAHNAGVTRIVTIGAGNGIESAHAAIALSEKHSKVWATVGVHPHDAAQDIDIATLKSLASHPKVVAIGETGLDFFRDWSPKERQLEWFQKQVELSIDIKKPLVIHCREAREEVFSVLSEAGAAAVGGVFHCYSEDFEFAERISGLNFIVSITGALTFKKNEPLRDLFRRIPLDRIMVETDAPYLAPEPFRGKRCESAHVLETAKALAIARGISLEEVANVTSENAFRLFGLDKR